MERTATTSSFETSEVPGMHDKRITESQTLPRRLTSSTSVRFSLMFLKSSRPTCVNVIISFRRRLIHNSYRHQEPEQRCPGMYQHKRNRNLRRKTQISTYQRKLDLYLSYALSQFVEK